LCILRIYILYNKIIYLIIYIIIIYNNNIIYLKERLLSFKSNEFQTFLIFNFFLKDIFLLRYIKKVSYEILQNNSKNKSSVNKNRLIGGISGGALLKFYYFRYTGYTQDIRDDIKDDIKEIFYFILSKKKNIMDFNNQLKVNSCTNEYIRSFKILEDI